jgi:adenine-specific DNA-methyltransferase
MSLDIKMIITCPVIVIDEGLREVRETYAEWSKDDLIDEIKKLKKRRKYGIVWDEERARESFEKKAKGKLPILKELKDREIRTKERDPINVLIEGDNYHALSVLSYTHKGNVDVIYIDPPYNTGKKDEWKFNDRYVDDEDAYRHSKWLSFMEKRLRLAKSLLKTEGVIFISIDDNEYAQLKLLCDEIYGEKNFVASIVWQKVYSPKNQSRIISTDHEFILTYAKKIDKTDFSLLPRTEKMNERYKNPDNDSRGLWQSGDLIANEERKNGHFIIKGPHGDEFDAPLGKHWAYSKENLEGFIGDNRIWFGKEGKSFPRLKQFLSEVQQGRKASTIFPYTEVGHSDEAKKELKEFFGQSEELFSTPKPTRLIKQILRLIKNRDAIVLDFFAGSGTTGQSTLELNREDGGNRLFILCTNNEVDSKTDLEFAERGIHKGSPEYEKEGICQKICYPRIEKVIKGYSNSDGKQTDGIGGNLKYFITDFVESEPTDQNKKKLVDQSTEMLCLKEDCFDEVCSGNHFRIFGNNNGNHMGIVYDDEGIAPIKEEIRRLSKRTNVYVFSLDESAREEEFEDIINLVRLKPIPEVILNVYRRIFR